MNIKIISGLVYRQPSKAMRAFYLSVLHFYRRQGIEVAFRYYEAKP